MKIKNYLNTTQKEVNSKKFSIWIGISLGNKFFTKENIREYILWALEKTKDDILVVIGDNLHSINLEILDGYNKVSALRKAIEIGDKKEKEINEIILELPPDKAKLIKIVRFAHVTSSKYHALRLEILRNEFKSNSNFNSMIIDTIKENKKVQEKQLSNTELDKLAEYIIQEIPVYLNGAKYGGRPEHGGKTYLLQIYPGIGLIDLILMKLQDGSFSQELTSKLRITDKIAIINGYPI